MCVGVQHASPVYDGLMGARVEVWHLSPVFDAGRSARDLVLDFGVAEDASFNPANILRRTGLCGCQLCLEEDEDTWKPEDTLGNPEKDTCPRRCPSKGHTLCPPYLRRTRTCVLGNGGKGRNVLRHFRKGHFGGPKVPLRDTFPGPFPDPP